MFPRECKYLRLLSDVYRREPLGRGPADWIWRALAGPYQAGAQVRRGLYQRGWLASKHLPAPVVSVGNLTVGGTGKTPVTAYLARLFQKHQHRVAILSRGYGGRLPGITCLSDGKHLFYRPPEVGEEAFELAQSLPGVLVYTGPCRYAAGMAAWREHRPDIFILDDGFQHFQLSRDLEIVLLDADRPFGNGRLLPAGPLREPLTTLREADVLILSRYDDRRHRDRLNLLQRLFPFQEIFSARIEPTSAWRFPGEEEHPPEALCGLAALAFAGLARPWVFRDTLTALGVDLRSLRAFPDHHAFTPGELADLLKEARARGVQALVTTAKDWARLGQIWQEDFPLWVLKVAARVEPEEAWEKYLATALGETAPIYGFKRVGFRETPSPKAPQPLPPQVRRRFQKLTRVGRSAIHSPDIRHILLRAPNWVGDAVMSLPVLAGLTHLCPAAQVTVLAAPRVAPLFAGQSGVAEVISYPAGREKWRTLWDLRGKFDLALALPNSFESALGLWLTRTPHRIGYAANGRTPFLTVVLQGRNRLRGLHQVFYYLGLLETLGPVLTFFPPRLQLSETEIMAGKNFLTSAGLHPAKPWVGLAPGAAYGPAKRWPASRFAALGDLLHTEFQADLVLLGGPSDQEVADEVQSSTRGRFLNLAGKTTLRQALTVLCNLKVLITNDSGLMHAASALGVPVVAIFGSTDPKATRPFTSRATLIHHHLPCSPCLERTCSQDYVCLTEITVAEVADAARAWLWEGR
jgi:lipopolysaccharide heptosyltransferase II/tetraacyldisaccharide 4'-kinase